MYKKELKIVIVGSGFAGITSLINLKKLDKNKNSLKITLISKTDHFLFTPLLHEVISGEIQEQTITYSIESLRKKIGKFDFINQTVTTIDFENNFVKTFNLSIEYDFLVIATGSTVNFYNNTAFETNAFTLKNIENALAIKLNILKNLSLLSEKAKKYNIAIVGGGYSGVEVTGAIVDLVENITKKNKIARKLINLYLIEFSDTLLGELKDNKISEIALKKLTSLGVTVLLKHKADNFLNSKLQIYDLAEGNNIELEVNTLIWLAGVKPSNLINELNLIKKNNGKIVVDSYLNTISYNNVFALGDIATFKDINFPTTAQTAMQQAVIVANNIVAKTNSFKFSKKFNYFHQGTVISIGSNFGVSDLFGFKLTSKKGLFFAKLIHFTKLFELNGQIKVFKDWLNFYLGKIKR